MTQGFQRFTIRYAILTGGLIGLVVVSSIMLHSGCGMTSSPRVPTPTPTPDTVRPTSTITSPTAGAIVLIGTPVAINGTASDAGGGSVVRVEVSVDGGATFSAATGTNAWSFNWTPSVAGQAMIRSRAVDNAGNVQDPPAVIQVTVDAPPTSTITSPAGGAIVLIGTRVAITGTASDPGGGSVVRVEVSVDGGATFSAATGTNAWSFNWTPSAAGPATIRSRAVDNTGNVQDPPAEIQVTVDAPPTSTITFPTEGATITLVPPIAITGTASDPGGGSVVRVEVSVDGGATYSAATGTNVWSFNWTPSAPGPTTIKSRAVDNTGNVQNPAAEIHVTKGPITIRVPSDRPTIQSAINDVTDGDTVLVAPGTYVENINFVGKAITVTSESGPQVTIIDGANADTVVRITSGEGRDSVINGFTLQNGKANFSSGFTGAGIKVQNSSPTITNNVIRNNLGCSGGGIGIDFGSPLIQLNTITGNSNNDCSGGGGGGINIRGASSVEILDNVISDNGIVSSFGGGIFMFAAGTPIIKRNIIKGNNVQASGGGIYMIGVSDALIVQNLITSNQAPSGGGIYSVADGRPILVNNTIANNHGISGSGIFVDGFTPRSELTNNIIVAKPGQTGLFCGSSVQEPPIIRFNNIFSDVGMAYGGNCADRTGTDGNISADPLFTNPTQGDYHLQQASPSIDSGANMTPNLPDTDVDGDPRILDGDGDGTATVDMGVDEFRRPIRVPSDQPTIQAAIDVATDGDRVLVAPGTYLENINFGGKAITVTSESGPQVTIIESRNGGTVVSFTSGERRDSVLNGFTLQNGSELLGGGITIQNSSPTITNNVIRNNQGCIGGGIGVISGSPLIRLNTITNNNTNICSGGGGSGICIRGASSVEILDNVISNNGTGNLVLSNSGGGIHLSDPGTAIVKRNIIKGNTAPGGAGGGIYIEMVNASDVLIIQNLITGNQADDGGGLCWIVRAGAGGRGPILVNNTIADNDATRNSSGIFADGGEGRVELTNNIIVAKPGQTALFCGPSDGNITPIIRFNNIFSSGGMAYGGTCADKTGTDGNISADPQFTNPAQGDYHLQQVSLSIDAGDNLTPNLPDTDIDGDPRVLDGDGNGTATIDMGVDEFLLPPGSTTPISTITSPKAGVTVSTGTTVSITGLARDAGGGTVARVEVSVDGGATWNVATGTTAWSFSWTPTTPGPATIKSRAVDDSGNTQDPPAEITVTVRNLVTIRVPSDQPTIQSAINFAIDGETVLVAPGTYVENINFRGKAITVRSESGPQVTIIDGGAADSVVVFASGEGRDSVLNGFTLQNGRRVQGTARGGGISVGAVSSPTITNNVITNNQACNGGGIGIATGSPLIHLNTITGNGNSGCAGGSGGGISIVGPSSAEVLDNVISDNTSSSGGGIRMLDAGLPIIKRNIIKGNNAIGDGGGIYMVNGSDALIVQNLITGNQASRGGGISWLNASGAILVNNTIADNNANSFGGGIFAEGSNDQTKLTNNIIVAKLGQTGFFCGPVGQNQAIIRFNNIFSDFGMAYGGSCSDRTGTNGNISADPLFIDPAQADYHLQQGSPAIDSGDSLTPNLLDTDLDGNPRILDGDGNGSAIVDMGVDEFLPSTNFNNSLQDESKGKLIKINSTNGQYLFTRYRGQEHERQYQFLFRYIGAPIFRSVSASALDFYTFSRTTNAFPKITMAVHRLN